MIGVSRGNARSTLAPHLVDDTDEATARLHYIIQSASSHELYHIFVRRGVKTQRAICSAAQEFAIILSDYFSKHERDLFEFPLDPVDRLGIVHPCVRIVTITLTVMVRRSTAPAVAREDVLSCTKVVCRLRHANSKRALLRESFPAGSGAPGDYRRAVHNDFRSRS